jgi:hypothetical protein
MNNRREFLQTTAAITGSLILPTSLFAKPSSNFHFIHADSCKHWPVPNPITWSLQNAHEPILASAADGLKKLTHKDNDRIIRLVTRRCSLNLLEIQGSRVHVQFWGTKGQAELKPFFKQHGLARPEITVELRDRKKETVTTLTGESFLYGVPIAPDFPLEVFQEKWKQRFVYEPNDSQAAPRTASGFAWDGIEDGCIPWMALKSAWRRGGSGVYLNCSGETLLTNFGLRQVSVFNRASCFDYVCGTCRRSFRDSVEDVPGWMVASLDENVRPGYEMVWEKRVKLEARS